MAEPSPSITLGSASPRRADLLARLGVNFQVAAVAIDEASLVTPDPLESVRAIAAAKFAAFADRDAELLITADTLVACDSKIMGKPDSTAALSIMLRAMSAREIVVATAVCSGPIGRTPRCETVTTTVRLRTLSDEDIGRYVASGVGMDKAGGLALQDQAGAFIEAVDGCWSNVLGLPVCVVAAALGTAETRRCSVELCGSHAD